MTTKILSNADIDTHELLTDDERNMCRVFRNTSRRAREPFTMLQFALIALRSTGRVYTNADVLHEPGATVAADLAHQKAAVLFVYEAFKACNISIIKEWPEFDEMLKNLENLWRELPVIES